MSIEGKVRDAILSCQESFVFEVIESIDAEHGELSADDSNMVMIGMFEWLDASLKSFELPDGA